MKKHLFQISVFLALLLAQQIRAEEIPIINGLKLFEEGKYTQASEALEKEIAARPKNLGALYFYLGVSYSKSQDFAKALSSFEAAKKNGYQSESIDYEIGQAYYAQQDLKNAETAFMQSIRNNFKVGTSAYYIGFLRQVKGEQKEAKDFYQRILELRSDPDQVKQPALFQIAEMAYENAEKIEDPEEKSLYLLNEVVPLYEKTRNYQLTSPTHDEAVKRLKFLALEVANRENRMRNGNPIPTKLYTLKLSSELGYDSNVITEADEVATALANKDSYYWKPGVNGKYQFNVDRRFSFIPELDLNTTYYFRRSTPNVYQNDNIVLAPALRSKWEHMSMGQAATLLFDIEYNHMIRDYTQAHKYRFYSRYWNVMLGEKVQWLGTGTTTVKASLKLYENYDPSRNSISPMITLQQNVKFFETWTLSNNFSVDYLRARDDVNDEKNFKMKHTIVLSNFIKNIDVTPTLNYSLKDTMKQRGERGNEININPTIEFAHTFNQSITGSIEYGFTRNFSRARTLYRYKKHEVKWIMDYRF